MATSVQARDGEGTMKDEQIHVEHAVPNSTKVQDGQDSPLEQADPPLPQSTASAILGSFVRKDSEPARAQRIDAKSRYQGDEEENSMTLHPHINSALLDRETSAASTDALYANHFEEEDRELGVLREMSGEDADDANWDLELAGNRSCASGRFPTSPTGRSGHLDFSRPTSASSRPMSPSSRPMSASSRPMSASSRPMSASSRPMSASSRPMSASSSRPRSASSRPMSASSTKLRPLSAHSRPGSASLGGASLMVPSPSLSEGNSPFQSRTPSLTAAETMGYDSHAPQACSGDARRTPSDAHELQSSVCLGEGGEARTRSAQLEEGGEPAQWQPAHGVVVMGDSDTWHQQHHPEAELGDAVAPWRQAGPAPPVHSRQHLPGEGQQYHDKPGHGNGNGSSSPTLVSASSTYSDSSDCPSPEGSMSPIMMHTRPTTSHGPSHDHGDADGAHAHLHDAPQTHTSHGARAQTPSGRRKGDGHSSGSMHSGAHARAFQRSTDSVSGGYLYNMAGARGGVFSTGSQRCTSGNWNAPGVQIRSAACQCVVVCSREFVHVVV